MKEVCKNLLEIKGMLLDPDNNKTITKEEFLSQLIFSLFGFEIEPTNSFTSRSGRTQIHLSTITNSNIQIHFEAILGYTAVAGSFEQQRNILNRRIDEAITKLGKNGFIKRHSEKIADTYSTTIEITGNNLTLNGVTICFEVINTILSCIEL
jgi:hypothetical protein